jgi:Ca2+-dependent lipid-binding protein
MPDPPRTGYIKIVVHDGTLSYSTQCCGKMDPYVYFALGKSRQKSSVCTSGHKNPIWVERPKFFFEIGELKEVNYDTLKIECYNKRVFCDDLVGDADVPVSSVSDVATNDPVPTWLNIPSGGKGTGSVSVKAGELRASILYIAPMVITLNEAKGIQDVQLIGKQDPYCIMDMVGCIAPGSVAQRKSRTHDDGDKTPKWNEQFYFNVLERSELDLQRTTVGPDGKEEKKADPGLWIQVIDENVVVDKAIGYCFISLMQLWEAKKASNAQWFPLHKGKKEQAGKEDCGSISITVA